MGPDSITRPPIAQMPAASAVSSMYPERRVSFPMTMRTDRAMSRRATKAMARPSRRATSGVIGGSFATPRIPSVPKSLRSCAGSCDGAFRLVTEVHELELYAKVFRANSLDARLQVVAVLAGDANLGLVNRALYLEFLVFDELRDFASRLDGDAFLHLDEQLG